MAENGVSRERNGRVAFAVLVLVIAAVAVWMAIGFPSRTARELPLLVGVPMILLALINVVVEVRKPVERAGPDAVTQAAQALEEDEDIEVDVGAFVDAAPDSDDGLSLPMAIFAVVLFVGLYLVFGQMASIPLGIVILLRMTRQSWLSVILTTAFTWTVIFTLSTELHVQTHPGWIDLGELIKGVFGV